MKNFFKPLIMLLTAVTVIFSVGCNGAVDYEMAKCSTQGLEYLVPSHFEWVEHEEADDYYVTVNSSILVYAYTHAEFGQIFKGYDGDFSALDVAEYIVELRKYNCSTYEGVAPGSAGYTFMYSGDDGDFYYTSSVHTTAERVYVLAFSCNAAKLEKYQDMIGEIMSSVSVKTEE